MQEHWGYIFEHFEKKKKEKKIEEKIKFREDYYNDLKNIKWIEKRKIILSRDNFKCINCNKKTDLHIHHLLYKNNKKAWEYDNDDLVTLCIDCHESEHKNFGTGSFKRALFYKDKIYI